MRACLVALVVLGGIGCSAPSDAPPAATGPIVGHVRLRDRTIDLTVDAFDARGGDPALRQATARHEAEVWADLDARSFEID
jgi:hypothetical protein